MKLQAISLKQGIKGPPLSLLIKNIREIKKAQSSIVKVPSTHPLPLTTAVLYSFHSLSNGGNNMVKYLCFLLVLLKHYS
ncbi:Cytochrome P450 protein [Gossypium arboreum]|uniref:Cytochrome P450 protein n=1 Tax=Gossypium arboreum TaxID=29729 RepID=A0A0B0PBT8_GOSAR|nr:Cytochrome P450 protein [Gossypium arboreum]